MLPITALTALGVAKAAGVDYNPKSDGVFTIGCNFNESLAIVQSSLKGIKAKIKDLSIDPDTGCAYINSRRGMSWKSNGEKLETVVIPFEEDKTSVVFKSKSKGLTIVDWGKNKQNVNKFSVELMKSGVSIAIIE